MLRSRMLPLAFALIAGVTYANLSCDKNASGSTPRNGNELRFATLLPYSGGWGVGAKTRAGWTEALKDVNAHPTILKNTGPNSDVNWTVVGLGDDPAEYDTGCSPSGGFEMLEKLEKSFAPDAWVASGCSTSCIFNARVAALRNTPYLSWGCESGQLSNVAEFPYFFRTVAPKTKLAYMYSDLMEAWGFREILLLNDDAGLNTFTNAAMATELARRNEEAGYEKYRWKQLQINRNSVTDNWEAEMQALASISKENPPQLVSIHGYNSMKRKVILSLIDMGIDVKNIQFFISQCVGTEMWKGDAVSMNEGRDDEILAAVNGDIDFEYAVVDESKGFSYNYAYYLYDAVFSMARAFDTIIRSNVDPLSEEATEAVVNTLKQQSFSGLTGTVSYDENHDRKPQYNVLNLQGTKTVRIGTWLYGKGVTFAENVPVKFSGGTATKPNICVARCSFHGTCKDGNCACNTGYSGTDCSQTVMATIVENKNRLDQGIVSFGSVLFGINALLSIFFFAWTLAQREHQIVRYSQPIFLCMIALGCLISSTTILFLSAEDNDEDPAGSADAASATCMLIPIFYSVGFVTTFSPLFAKMWKVKRIFRSGGSLKVVRITGSFLVFRIILPILLVDGIVLGFWASNDPVQYIRVAFSVDQMANATISSGGFCRSKGNSWTYIGLIAAIHFALLIYGNYLTYACRNVDSRFSESKFVAFAMVSHLQVLMIGLPVLAIVADDVTSNYFVRAGIVFLNDLTALCFIFLPKFLDVHFNLGILSSGSVVSGNTSRGKYTAEVSHSKATGSSPSDA